jgi:hypothetical protein
LRIFLISQTLNQVDRAPLQRIPREARATKLAYGFCVFCRARRIRFAKLTHGFCVFCRVARIRFAKLAQRKMARAIGRAIQFTVSAKLPRMLKSIPQSVTLVKGFPPQADDYSALFRPPPAP